MMAEACPEYGVDKEEMTRDVRDSAWSREQLANT